MMPPNQDQPPKKDQKKPTRRRVAANIDFDIAEKVKRLAQKHHRSFAGEVHALLELAMSLHEDKNAISLERAKQELSHWGLQELREIVITGINLLSEPSQEDLEEKLAADFLAKIIAGKKPTSKELAKLAEVLDVDSELLARLKLVNFQNGEKK